MARASWENILRRSIQVAGYDGSAAQPSYQIVYDWCPTDKLHALALNPEKKRLIRVNFSAVLQRKANTVNNTGFLGAVLFYPGWGGGEDDFTPGGIWNYGNMPPTVGEAINADAIPPYETAESYDPVPLPVGGVDFPIWTRDSIDPLSVNMYANANNQSPTGGALWACTLMQINGSITEPLAVAHLGKWWWEEIENGQEDY